MLMNRFGRKNMFFTPARLENLLSLNYVVNVTALLSNSHNLSAAVH